MSKVAVVWLKRDLRMHDHPALQAALAVRPSRLVVLYLYEPLVVSAEDFDGRHLSFINDCLAELDQVLRARGNRLVTLEREILPTLCQLRDECAMTHLFSHEEAGHQETYDRDRAVMRWCHDHGVSWTELPQNGVIRRLRSRDGWAQKWARRMKREQLPLPEILPPPVEVSQLQSVGKKHPHEFDLESPPAGIQRGGSEAGYGELNSFLQHRGEHYTRAMSSPVTGFTQCSRISPYLSWGALSVRECYQIARERSAALKESPPASAAEKKRWNQALRSFTGRLRWHCHFMQKLEDEPKLHTCNLSSSYNGLRENDWNESYFRAWKNGQTGYPLVDACMRAVRETGYLNFRMRAMVMSFASYHLWLHWRKTGLYLAKMFTDYEPGIHWSQVQMQSGTTGINSIRVYSPPKQTTDHDPEGVFIKEWVPELASLPSNYLAAPWNAPEMELQFAGIALGIDYPHPIVEHKSAYKYAQDRLFSAKKRAPAKKEAARIQKKHGSRRKRV